MKKAKIYGQLFIILAIVVMINLISNRIYFRLDFTADERYTLSSATEEILTDLVNVVTITAYFSEDLPPQLMNNRRDFEDLLVEYEDQSQNNIVYNFVNPNESDAAETEAQQQGIGPLVINVTERDQIQQMRAYMGAVIQMGDAREVIPVIQPGSAMEYSLTTAIKKLAITDKPKIGFLQGHGQPGLSAMPQLLTQLTVLYDVEPYTLEADQDIPLTYRALAIIDPTDTIAPQDFEKLDRFLEAGGDIFISYSNLSGDLSSGSLGKGPDIGMVEWLGYKGIEFKDQYVVDVKCGSVSVRQQQGPFVFNTQIQFPFFPMIARFSDHPAVQGIETLGLPFTAALGINPVDSAINIQPLALSSEQSGLVNAPSYVDINKEWGESDFRDPNQIIAVSLEGPIEAGTVSRMVVIANGRFAVNGEPEQQQQLSPDNVNFASNSIDWLADDTGLIDLRTKGITARPLDPVEDNTRNLIKYGNVVFPIIFILVYGLVRRQGTIRKRQRWLQGQY